MVTVYQLDGTESEPIAEYHDGEWTSGADAMEPVFGEEPPTQEELLESLDGPRLFASMPEDEPVGASEKSWMPYEGPEGGEGWKDTDSGEVVYSDDPPGEVIGPTEIERAARDAGLSEEQIEELIARAHEAVDQRTGEEDGRLPDHELPLGDDGRPIRDEDAQNAGFLWEGPIVDEQDALTILETYGDGDGIPFDSPQEAAQSVWDAGEHMIQGMPEFEGETPSVDSMEELAEAMVERQETEIRYASEEEVDAVDDHLSGWLPEDLSGIPDEDIWTQYGWADEETAMDLPDAPEDEGSFSPDSRQELAEWAAEEGSMNPFADVTSDVPDSMDPAAADDVGKLSTKYGGGGRSESSMYVADGVPDEDGNDRRLFVTNTNPERGDSQGRYNGGDRTVASNAGLEEAGVPVPRAARTEGEFWVTEELAGEPASDSGWEDISDNPEDVKWEMAEMMSGAFGAGVWDVHGDNIFVTDDGELAVVDTDLGGSSLSADANRFDNPMSMTQLDAWERYRGLWETLGMDEQDDVSWEETVDATISRFEQRDRDGEIDDIVDAASSAADSTDIKGTIRENKSQSDDFFDGMREEAYEVSPW